MDLVTRDELLRLMEEHDGLCVSIYMPTHPIGSQNEGDPIRLKNLLRAAEDDLVAAGMRAPEARQLLEPAQKLLTEGPFWLHTSNGLALFLSKAGMTAYRVPLELQELAVVTDRFHLKPLLAMLTGDGRFYLLALSQKAIRLFEGTRFSIRELDLEGIPGNIYEALRWDDPEKQLQHRVSEMGGKGGPKTVVFHGHASWVDESKTNILRYCNKIDKALSPFFADESAPLVLAGVDYLHPLYREANTYRYLLEDGVIGNPDDLSAKQLHELAWAIVEPHFLKEQELAVECYQQSKGTGLTTDRIEEAAPAAYDGRIDTLFVPLGVRRWGSFDPESRQVVLHEERMPDDEDLMDYTAVMTLSRRGAVYVVEPAEIPDQKEMAALFRY